MEKPYIDIEKRISDLEKRKSITIDILKNISALPGTATTADLITAFNLLIANIKGS